MASTIMFVIFRRCMGRRVEVRIEDQWLPSNGSRPNFAMKSFRASATALLPALFHRRARARCSFREIDIL